MDPKIIQIPYLDVGKTESDPYGWILVGWISKQRWEDIYARGEGSQAGEEDEIGGIAEGAESSNREASQSLISPAETVHPAMARVFKLQVGVRALSFS